MSKLDSVLLTVHTSMRTGLSGLTAHDMTELTQYLPYAERAANPLKAFDRQLLAPLRAIDRAARRECMKHCISGFGGFITSEDQSARLLATLREYKRRFDVEAQSLMTRLEGELSQLAAQRPELRASLEKMRAEVKAHARFHFSYEILRLSISRWSPVAVTSRKRRVPAPRSKKH